MRNELRVMRGERAGFWARCTFCLAHFFRRLVAGFLVSIILTTLAPAASFAVFADVPAGSSQAAAIAALVQSGAIAGYPDGTFRPQNKVNRAEALKILLLGSGIVVAAAGSSFADVPSVAWFAPFIAAAKTRGIAAGYPDGLFRPEQTVNRVEALKMLLAVNAVDLTNYQTSAQLFSDTQLQAWYNPQLLYARTFGLINLSSNRAQPASALTRGELAEVVYAFQTRVARVCPAIFANADTVATDAFAGITLIQALPRLFATNEVLTVTGQTAAETVTVFYANEWGEQTAAQAPVSGGSFRVQIQLAQVGALKLAVLPGSSGSVHAAAVTVLPRECEPPTVAGTADKPSDVTVATGSDNKPEITWTAAENTVTRVRLSQAAHQIELLVAGGENRLALTPATFADWQPGAATVQLFAARAVGGSMVAARTAWTAGSAQTIQLSSHHFSTRANTLAFTDDLPLYQSSQLNLTGRATVPLEPTAFLTDPAGRVTELPLTSADTLAAGQTFVIQTTLSSAGTYFLELNDTTGLAVLNHPLYPTGTLPLLPDFADRRDGTPLAAGSWDLENETTKWLRLINAARAVQNLPPVALDPQLTALAQNYAARMARENFFAHTDPVGQTPDDRRRAIGFPLPIGENLAMDNTVENAHAGLLRSGSHRANLQDPAWGRVGLGIAQTAHGELVLVQEFAANTLSNTDLTQLKTQLFNQISAPRNLTLDAALAAPAQSWADQMAADDFAAFTAPSGTTLESVVRTAGFSGSFKAFVGVAATVADLVDLIAAKQALGSSTYLAIGLAQDSEGQLRILLLHR